MLIILSIIIEAKNIAFFMVKFQFKNRFLSFYNFSSKYNNNKDNKIEYLTRHDFFSFLCWHECINCLVLHFFFFLRFISSFSPLHLSTMTYCNKFGYHTAAHNTSWLYKAMAIIIFIHCRERNELWCLKIEVLLTFSLAAACAVSNHDVISLSM